MCLRKNGGCITHQLDLDGRSLILLTMILKCEYLNCSESLFYMKFYLLVYYYIQESNTYLFSLLIFLKLDLLI
jgi:hypothetical protein